MPITDQWKTIRTLTEWLDRENGRGDHEMAMRLLKIAEEAGEAAAAYIGWRGQNPRKGVTHTAGDVADELVDVMVTAAVALVSLGVDDPAALVADKLGKIAARVGVQTEPTIVTVSPDRTTVVVTINPDPTSLEQAMRRLVTQAANWPRRGA